MLEANGLMSPDDSSASITIGPQSASSHISNQEATTNQDWNDSEAETEILLGSQSQTPVKGDLRAAFMKKNERAVEQEHENRPTPNMTNPQDTTQTNGISRGRHSRHNSHAGGKRKAHNDDSNASTNGHGRSTRSHAGSPVKKARLTPERSPSRATSRLGGLENRRNRESLDNQFKWSKDRKSAQSPTVSEDESKKAHALGPVKSRDRTFTQRTSQSPPKNIDLPSSSLSSSSLSAFQQPSTTSSVDLLHAEAIRKRLQSLNPTPHPTHSTNPKLPRSLSSTSSTLKQFARHRHSSASPPRSLTSKGPSHPDSSTHRALTHEPRTRSTSPPGNHKRSSSFQSSLPSLPDQERLLRTRRHIAQIPTIPASSRHTAEPKPPDANESPSAANLSMASRTSAGFKDGATPLARAAEKGELDKVQTLLNDPTMADIDTPDYSQNRPIQKAALHGHLAVVELLIDHGANVNVCNNADVCGGDTPLIDAIDAGHVEVVKALLEAGANPWKKNANFDMPHDCLTKANLDEDTSIAMRTLLGESMAAHLVDDDDPCQSSYAPDAVAKADKTKLCEEYTVKEMEKRIRASDYAGFHRILATRIKPNLACAIAAAHIGDVHLYEKIFSPQVGADLPTDPESINGDIDTPLLVAIGRGNLEMVQHIIGQDGFNASRIHNGLSYSQLAKQRRGPNMIVEVEILELAARGSYVGTDTLVTRKSQTDYTDNLPIADGLHLRSCAQIDSEEDFPFQQTALEIKTESYSDAAQRQSGSNKRRRLMRRNQMSAADLRALDEEPEDTSTDIPASDEILPRVDPVLERKKYLNTLPAALASALTPEGALAGSREQVAVDERIWKKSAEFYFPIPVFQRCEIDPCCPPGTSLDLFTLNIHVAMIARLATLQDPKTVLGLETIAMTADQKAKIERVDSLPGDLGVTNNWAFAPMRELERVGVPFKQLAGGGRSIGLGPLMTEGRAKFHALDLEEVFYVELGGFIRHTGSLYWLKDVDISTNSAMHFGADWTIAKAPIFANSRITMETDEGQEW